MSYDNTRMTTNLSVSGRGDQAGPVAFAGRLEIVGSGGDVAEALVDLAVQADAEILVIGQKSRSRVGKFLMGSTVQRVLLDAPMPVLVPRPE